ncbi:MAG: DinB family protein [Spirochaetes bacterium]|nr:DinB family protein [Spirochaetota bacterium]
MKRIIDLLAEYNAMTNRDLMAILDAVPQDLLRRITGSYFGSILGTLMHLLNVDLLWLERISAGNDRLQVAEIAGGDLRKGITALNDSRDYGQFKEIRKRMDQSILDTVKKMDEAMLAASVRYTDARGAAQEKPLFIVMLHMFNHQTHHRGQITEVLDQHGVENDISNISWKF